MVKHIPHLFVNDNEINSLSLSDDSFHHLIHVLRFKSGYEFIILNNQGLKAHCIIKEIKKNGLFFEILKITNNPKSLNSLNLFQAITKVETFEEILDKATQLGVSLITPVITENINTSLDIFNKKYSRFNKILRSSAEQSQRIYLPILNNIISLQDLYNQTNADNTFIAYEKSTIPLKFTLENFKGQNINLFCGPEGGFTDNEAEFLSEKFKTFSLGKNILRAETAVLSGLSNIIYQLDLF